MKRNMQGISMLSSPSAAALAAMLFAGSVAAQTFIPGSLKAPAGTYDTSKRGILVRSHRVAVTRTPGDANSIVNVERQLRGGYGPNLAAAGTNPDGTYTVDFVDFNTSSGTWNDNFFNDLMFPGINSDIGSPEYSITNVAVEVVAFLNLKAGINRLGVHSGDSFRLTVGNGANPYDATAIQPANAIYSGGRVGANNEFELNAESAGVYPVRLVFGNSAGEGTLEFYSVESVGGTPTPILVNDPSYTEALVSYLPSAIPIVPGKAYLQYAEPLPGQGGVTPQPTLIAEIKDTTTTVATNSILLTLDGSPVTAQISQTAAVTTVSGVPNVPLGPGTRSATVIFRDSAGTWSTNTWSFNVQQYHVIPAEWGYAAGAQDTSKPGFKGVIKVPRKNAAFSSTVGIGNSHIEGTLVDPNTGEPFVNYAATTTNGVTVGVDWLGYMLAEPGGSFVEPGVINYATDGSGAIPANNFGNAYAELADTNYPGVPGLDPETSMYDNAAALAIELTGFIELTPGLHLLGLHADDGAQLAIHGNDTRDIFRVSLAENQANDGGQNLPATVLVQRHGLYPVRILQQRYQNEAPSGLEFWSASPANPNARTLVNSPAGFKVWRQLAVPSRPYVKSVTPRVDSTGVSVTNDIQVVLVNLGTNVPVLKVAGSPVNFTTSVSGNETTLTYRPTAQYPGASVVEASVSYGGLAANWSFVTKTGLRALMITGPTPSAGDNLIAQRLAAVHGLDVTMITDAMAKATDATNHAAGSSLILFSSTALAGNNNVSAVGWHMLPIPIINWEQAYSDDLRMDEQNVKGNNNGQTTLNMVGAGHPLAAGLTNGQYVFSTSAYQVHFVNAPASGVTIATDLNNPGRGLVWGLEAGGAVNNTNPGEPFTHPAKRLELGFAGDSGATTWTTNAFRLFDAAIGWMLPGKIKIPTLSNGNVTITWSGTGVLEESAKPAGPWNTSANQANPQTRPAVGNMFFRLRP